MRCAARPSRTSTIRRALLAALALLFGAHAHAEPQRPIDYYILALSWSPAYCASGGAARREPLQCNTRRGFIVHGLWPQYNNGFPTHCVSDLPRTVAPELQRKQLDITPSAGLVVHEWQTHGLCTGLKQSVYFDATRTLRNKIKVPPAFAAPAQDFTSTPAALRSAFVKANPGMSPQGLAILCDKAQLESVRICFSNTGAFRQCAASVRDTCRPGNMRVPASQLR